MDDVESSGINFGIEDITINLELKIELGRTSQGYKLHNISTDTYNGKPFYSTNSNKIYEESDYKNKLKIEILYGIFAIVIIVLFFALKCHKKIYKCCAM